MKKLIKNIWEWVKRWLSKLKGPFIEEDFFCHCSHCEEREEDRSAPSDAKIYWVTILLIILPICLFSLLFVAMFGPVEWRYPAIFCIVGIIWVKAIVTIGEE